MTTRKTSRGSQISLIHVYGINFIHLSISLILTHESGINAIGFVGVYCSLFLVVWMVNTACEAVYNTYIGVILGHNVNLGRLGGWAIVTGATDGIGLEYARQLAAKGVNIVLISRSMDKLEFCANQIRNEYSVKTKTVQVDFSLAAEYWEERVEQDLSGMDISILINNVGMTYSSPEYFHVVSALPNFISNIVNLNITAATVMTKLILPGMLDKDKGVIVNVGSCVSIAGTPFFSLYAASKSFLQTLTLDLALEYSDTGIIFQYQCPGYITTKMAKIKTASLFIPSPHDYVKVALNSIGLQEFSSIWVPQRLLTGVGCFLYVFYPKFGMNVYAKIIKSFWMFAKKRQMQKDEGYMNYKNV